MHLISQNKYNSTLHNSDIKIHGPKIGDEYIIGDEVKVEIIGTKNLEIIKNAINNSSLDFKVISKSKSILCTGDLVPEGGNKILLHIDAVRLKSDYVQIAHHGQARVTKEFYATVNPQYALCPTPKW
jgi:beta-lactamase superfamily II metal-dependent hydrolase